MDDDYDDPHDAGWFKDERRQRDRLIAELRSERDEQTDLIRRGSIESVWRCPSHFRFIPHSRHLLGDTARPFCAKSGSRRQNSCETARRAHSGIPARR